MDKIMLNYVELFKTGSDPKSFFKLLAQKPVVEHKAKDVQWFGCVLWDDVSLKEFRIHEEMEGTLQTKMFLGRMLRNCIKDPFEGIAKQMKWMEPFLLVDVVGDKFGTCGINKSLRVRETPTWNTSGSGGGGDEGCHSHDLRTWDLVIFPECLELAQEMIRPEYSGVKKTVCIWNSEVSPYPKSWIDCGGAQVSGEIFLKPTRKMDEKILTVIIFHHGELRNFEGVPVQNLKTAGEGMVVKLRSESYHHYERMVAKLYPGWLQKNDLTGEETDAKREIGGPKLPEGSNHDTGNRNDEKSVPVSMLRDIVEQLPVNDLEPLKDKLKKLRSERMETKLDQKKQEIPGSCPEKHSAVSVSEKDTRIREDNCLAKGPTSVVTSDDDDITAGSGDRGEGEEAIMVIDQSDYENSDAQSDAMSIDVMKEADREVRQLAEYFLGFRK